MVLDAIQDEILTYDPSIEIDYMMLLIKETVKRMYVHLNDFTGGGKIKLFNQSNKSSERKMRSIKLLNDNIESYNNADSIDTRMKLIDYLKSLY